MTQKQMQATDGRKHWFDEWLLKGMKPSRTLRKSGEGLSPKTRKKCNLIRRSKQMTLRLNEPGKTAYAERATHTGDQPSQTLAP